MPLNKFKAIFFDFGNTLIPLGQKELDYIDQETFSFLEKHLGKIDFEKFKQTRDKTKERPYQDIPPTFIENSIQEVIQDMLFPFTDSLDLLNPLLDIRRKSFIKCGKMPKYLPNLLKTLSNHFQLSIVSNYPDSYPIISILEKFNLTKYFNSIIVSGDIGYVKPSSIIFEKALNEINCKPDEVLFVGDNWYMDIIGASKIGMATAYTKEWVDKKTFDEGLKHCNPVFILNNLQDLIGFCIKQ
ncbi:MAG: HAD family hydrolase [bacterium]